jgi:signal transduction histidine kinase
MMFGNIIDNAYNAFSERKGRINVSVSRVKPGFIAIEVRDSGTGIDAADMEKIFEPFFSRRSRGTGLGLAVCRQIVELHGGRIEVESVKGKGSLFRVVLPAKRQAQA